MATPRPISSKLAGQAAATWYSTSPGFQRQPLERSLWSSQIHPVIKEPIGHSPRKTEELLMNNRTRTDSLTKNDFNRSNTFTPWLRIAIILLLCVEWFCQSSAQPNDPLPRALREKIDKATAEAYAGHRRAE